jgi:hypothetical protein
LLLRIATPTAQQAASKSHHPPYIEPPLPAPPGSTAKQQLQHRLTAVIEHNWLPSGSCHFNSPLAQRRRPRPPVHYQHAQHGGSLSRETDTTTSHKWGSPGGHGPQLCESRVPGKQRRSSSASASASDCASTSAHTRTRKSNVDRHAKHDIDTSTSDPEAQGLLRHVRRLQGPLR